jgi:hypothetical protein
MNGLGRLFKGITGLVESSEEQRIVEANWGNDPLEVV